MSKFRTRMVMDARPGARQVASNACTLFAPDLAAAIAHPSDFAAAFRLHYSRIRDTCLEFAEPGVAVFAFRLAPVWPWAGSVCLAARPAEVRAAVVGRHAEADLFLGTDPGVALRHLAFIIEPCSLQDALRGDVRFRVLDLATGHPPVDESGRAVESLTAEGPVLLTCPGHMLMALVTGDPTDWPESADDAWACLPERIFVHERLAPLASGSGARPLPARGAAPRSGRRTTVVRRHDGPCHLARKTPVGDEPAVARLRMLSDGKESVLPTGRESLRRGILIGRYDRCDAGGPANVSDNAVSRVHLLVIEVAGRPFAFDLASSNGTYKCASVTGDYHPVQVEPLTDGAILALGGGDTLVAWTTAEGAGHASFDPGGFAAPPMAVQGSGSGARVASASIVARPVAEEPPVVQEPAAEPPEPQPQLTGPIDSRRAAEYLRSLPRYQEASPLEKEVWERYCIPMAIALAEREDGDDRGPCPAPPLSCRLAAILYSMDGDGLGLFDDPSHEARLLPHIREALRRLRATPEQPT